MNKCDVCNNYPTKYTACSIFGAFTISLCEACYSSQKEPYSLMVSSIGCSGRFPDDINDVYIAEVRRQLKLHGKTEEQFIKDVDDYNRDLMEAMKSVLESKRYD